MLIEFSVENYRSFRDRATLSMIAANLKSADKRLDEENTIPISSDLRLLTSAAIYGKNAGGKSNLGAALKFMQDFVINSTNAKSGENGISVLPFLFNNDSRQKPSCFEVVFIVESIQYRYGFEVDATHVISEWLYYVPSRREYILFERNEQEIRVKSAFKEGRGLEKRTRPDALFLSVAIQFNGVTAEKLAAWFGNLSVNSGLQDEDFRSFTLRCLREGPFREEIVNFVKSLDVDLDGLAVGNPIKGEDLPSSLSEEQKQRTSDHWKDQENMIFALHTIYNGKGEYSSQLGLNIDAIESEGTRRIIALAGPLHRALKEGSILFIDEMDARLHTVMTASIIRLFNSKKTNPRGAQLIFVTHDTNLLDNTLLRRDQIWFAEKDRQGATHLISLAEFQERNDADFEKRYLGGRYGGVPSLGELNALFESAHG